jgi:ABC-type antimicrobial peptide transport system permease subunit
VPVEQSPIGAGYLLVRTQGDAQSMIPALVGRLREVAPALAFDRVERVVQTLEESRAATRFLTQAAAVSAGLALVLSMIGVYGLTAGDVSARRREVAIRLALGASRSNVLWTVVRPCAAVLGAGTALGLLLSVSVGPAMAFLLHGVDPTDVPSFVIAPVLLVGIGMIAAGIAASRVLRTSASVALQSD